MNRDELIIAFKAHIATLTQEERDAFTACLTSCKQTTNQVYGIGAVCVMGAFATSHGLPSVCAVRSRLGGDPVVGVTTALAKLLNVPCVDVSSGSDFSRGGPKYPAMVLLNDEHDVTFKEFIQLIEETKCTTTAC